MGFASEDVQGLGLRHLYTLQSITGLEDIISYCHTDQILGRICLQHWSSHYQNWSWPQSPQATLWKVQAPDSVYPYCGNLAIPPREQPSPTTQHHNSNEANQSCPLSCLVAPAWSSKPLISTDFTHKCFSCQCFSCQTWPTATEPSWRKWLQNESVMTIYYSIIMNSPINQDHQQNGPGISEKTVSACLHPY